MDSPVSTFSSSSPSTPNGKYTHEQALEYIRDLETEYNDFTKVYKNIELELEQELADAALEKTQLQEQLSTKDVQLRDLKSKLEGLSNELNELTGKQQETTSTLKGKLKSNQEKLTTVEILNDTFENNERQIISQLTQLRDANNELLEKTAILENDLMVQREHLIKEKLNRTNDSIVIADLKQQITKLTNELAASQGENQRLRKKVGLQVNNKPPKVSRHTTSPVKTKDPSKYIPGDSPNASFVSPPARVVAKASLAVPKSSSMKQLHEMIAKQETVNSRFSKFKRLFSSVRTSSSSTPLAQKNSTYHMGSSTPNLREKHQKPVSKDTIQRPVSGKEQGWAPKGTSTLPSNHPSVALHQSSAKTFPKSSSSTSIHQSLSAKRDLSLNLIPKTEGAITHSQSQNVRVNRPDEHSHGHSRSLGEKQNYSHLQGLLPTIEGSPIAIRKVGGKEASKPIHDENDNDHGRSGRQIKRKNLLETLNRA